MGRIADFKEKMKSRAAELRKSSAPDFLMTPNMFLLRGGASGTCFFAKPDGMGAEPEHPAGGGFEFAKDVSQLNTGLGGAFELNAPVNKVAFDGMVMNPRAKVKPPSLVDHYPLMMKQPPTVITAQYKSVLGPLLAILKSLAEEL